MSPAPMKSPKCVTARQSFFWYSVDKDWPGPMVRVLVWGNGPTRFGYRDDLGNWRGGAGAFMRSTPKMWSEIPVPPR